MNNPRSVDGIVPMISALYVDDETDLLHIVKIFLERTGEITVDTCSSAQAILKSPKISSYDVIISDYLMAGMNGIDFLKEIRTTYGDIPFILFTGRGRQEVAIEALNNGADFYLQKGGDPVSLFAELVNNIRITVSKRRAEKLLVESQKRVLDIINFLPDATFAIDNSGKVIAWNYAMEEITGIQGEEILGKGDYAYTIPFYGEKRKHLLDLIDSDDEELKKLYLSIERKGKTLFAEAYTPALYGGKGGYIWVTGTPLFDVHGNRVGAIESIRDITDKHRTEEELIRKNKELRLTEHTLRVSEERLLMAQEISHTGCWEYHPDKKQIWASDEAFRIFGFTPGSDGILPIERVENRIPDRIRVNKALIDLITQGLDYNLEYLIQPEDGSEQKMIHSVARRVEDADGNLIRTVGIIQDITWRKNIETELLRKNEELAAAFEELTGAEEELRHQYNLLVTTEEHLHQTKDLLESLISNANVPIVIWDTSLQITRFNHAFELLIGRSSEEVIGLPIHSLFSTQQPGFSEKIQEITENGVTWETTEIDIMHRDGTPRTLVWNAATLYSQDGKTPLSTIAQGYDVTEERKLEREKDTLLGQIQQNLAYLAILNDEIRNPLTIILTYAELLENADFRNQIMLQTERIDQIVTQLDKRWIESEKVLSAIRKHYQIHLPFGEENTKGSRRI